MYLKFGIGPLKKTAAPTNSGEAFLECSDSVFGLCHRVRASFLDGLIELLREFDPNALDGNFPVVALYALKDGADSDGTGLRRSRAVRHGDDDIEPRRTLAIRLWVRTHFPPPSGERRH
jgi:hypothetical protein